MTALLFGLILACSGAPHPGMVHVEDQTAQGGAGPAGDYWIDRYEYPDRAGQKPDVYVDLETAEQRCATAGKRLCTAAEWRRACEGPTGLRYSYGPTHEDGRCHTEQRLESGHTSMMDPAALVSESGAFADCKSTEGVFDMIGNAEEWVLEDWHGVGGMLEGGAWYTWSGYANCTGAYSRQPDYRLDPQRAVFSAGFRCCWSQAAPTREALSPAAIASDSQARLRAAPNVGTGIAYDPSAEAQISPGLFMDIYEFPNRAGAFPRTVVSWSEAQTLCKDAGKRLCQASEWERACTGSDARRYPYGDHYVPGACAISLASPPRSGEAYACIAQSGVLDLVGGVWEWTMSELDARALSTAGGGTLRELRGGSWQVDPVKGVCEPYDGYPLADEAAVFPDVGFRCCRGSEQDAGMAAAPGRLACPPEMASLAAPATGKSGDFCIDRTELPGRPGSMPLMNLDLNDARGLCTDRGKHLCTESEWLLACAGSKRRRWPYGDQYVAERCNDAGAEAPGIGGNAVPSGSLPDCLTPDGVFDLSGNVWEWTTTTQGAGVLHGGGWNLSAGLNQCRAVARAQTDQRLPEFGGRCCASAQEAAKLLERTSP